ncbi:hypothetical protein ACXZ9C_11580 [Streptococcus agalactiae]
MALRWRGVASRRVASALVVASRRSSLVVVVRWCVGRCGLVASSFVGW